MKFIFEPLFSGGRHGSSIPYIVLSDLSDFNVIYNQDIVYLFVNKVYSLFYYRMDNNRDQIEYLENLRNSLLPLLMNGQVSIKK